MPDQKSQKNQKLEALKDQYQALALRKQQLERDIKNQDPNSQQQVIK